MSARTEGEFNATLKAGLTATLVRAVKLADKQDGSENADRMTVLWDDSACYVLVEESIGLTVAYSAGGPRKWDRVLWVPSELLPAVIEAAQRVLAGRSERGL